MLQGGPSLDSHSWVAYVAGIKAVQAYHAGAIRTLLFQNYTEVIQPYNVTINDAAAVSVEPGLQPTVSTTDPHDMQCLVSPRDLYEWPQRVATTANGLSFLQL